MEGYLWGGQDRIPAGTSRVADGRRPGIKYIVYQPNNRTDMEKNEAVHADNQGRRCVTMNMERQNLVMIVDDNSNNLKYLTEIVESNGYEALKARTAEEVFEFLENSTPDIILLNALIPDVDSFAMCKNIKKREEAASISVIFIFDSVGHDEIDRMFAAGAIDYVTRPFNGLVLNSRIRAYMDLKQSREHLMEYYQVLEYTNTELQAANNMVINANSKLQEAIERAETLSRRDYLTGLYNRLYLMERIKDEIKRFERSGRHFGIIIGDIDNFKLINDNYGHECGDYVLRSVSKIIQKEIRGQDSLGRWGGEEFLLMLPETGVCGAAVTAEKIREIVSASVLEYNDLELAITMTFGVYFYDGCISIDEVIKKADSALMEGKDKGKNAVVMAE